MTEVGAGPVFRYPDSGSARNGVVVDCANMLYRGGEVEVGRLISVLRLIGSKGWPCYAGLKEGTYYMITKYKEEIPDKQKSLLETLLTENKITLIRSKEDDRYLLRLAIEGDHYLVSNDKYRDWMKENPKLKEDIQSRLKKVVFIGKQPTIEIPDCPAMTIIGKAPVDDAGTTVCISDSSGNEHNFGLLKTIGRSSFEGSPLYITKPEHISRSHLQFSRQNSELVVIDLGSTNGTVVDGFRLAKNVPCHLTDGSVLRVGAEENEFIISL